MNYLTGFVWFWYDFIVGDAWEIALGVVVVMAALWAIIEAQPNAAVAVGPILPAALIVITAASLWFEQRGRRL
ncbi:MAG: hypothetical protein NTZ05_11395 [Chloroflexi bacterium]|nr:hypothetical protein [Chloroflexota bacterium]